MGVTVVHADDSEGLHLLLAYIRKKERCTFTTSKDEDKSTLRCGDFPRYRYTTCLVLQRAVHDGLVNVTVQHAPYKGTYETRSRGFRQEVFSITEKGIDMLTLLEVIHGGG